MAITAEQKYLLNKMNTTAAKVQLGTLLDQAGSVSAGEITLANGSILIGNGSGVAAANAVTGDVVISNTGVTSISAGVIVNADVNASAGIVYSKLSLADSIVNADVNTAAAIAYSKLALTNSIVAGDLTAASVTLAKLHAGVAPSHVVKYAGTINTIASASQSLAVVGVLATDVVMVTFKTNVNTVALVTAAANTDAIDVVFSGDPGVSAVYYQVLRAAV